jgi:hypothetical protein
LQWYLGVWYLGVCLILSLLSIRFAPLPNAPNGGLFVTDDIVDDANEYCARVPACNQACSCNVWSEKDCDFEDMATLYEAGWGMGFGLTILAVALYAVALVGVVQASPKLLKPFLFVMPALVLLALVPGILINVADNQIWKAWLLNDPGSNDDWKCNELVPLGTSFTVDLLTFSICCASFEDDVDRLLTLGIAGGWIVYFIQMAVVASQVFEVRVLIAYVTKAT